MRLTFLGHACHLVEVDGRRILTDPWLCDPIFEGHVERAPPLGFGPADLPRLDALALTHGHLDHFNAPALAALPDKAVPVILPASRFTELEANLRRLGFDDLRALRDWDAFELGSLRIVATPSPGVLDECAYSIAGRGGHFWNGADAPQPPALIDEIARRLGAPDVAALSHNSFDQPALLGLASHKAADHAPRSAAETARRLAAPFVLAAASNMRWRGAGGPALTRRVIRRGAEDLARCLADGAPATRLLDLAPGDAWSREGGIERGALAGTPAPPVRHDYVHAFLATGERYCPPGRPSTQESFERDLPARTRRVPEASRYLGQRVCFEITGDDPGTWTVDFGRPGAPPEPGDPGAPCAARLDADDWKDLFERRIPWQVLLVSDRLRISRFEPGAPPLGLHFAYALQALFP